MSVKGNDTKFSDGFDFGIQESSELSSAQMFDLLDKEEVETKSLEQVDPKKKKALKKETIKDAEDEEVEEIEPEEEDLNLLDQLEDEPEEEKETAPESALPQEEAEEENEINPYASVAKNLFELGIFTQDDDEDDITIETGEDLRDRFEYEKKKSVSMIIENYLSRKGPEYKEMFDAVFVNGVSPREYLQAYSDVQDFTNADLSDKNVQMKVVAEALKLQGFDDSDIDSELKEMEEYGTLEDKAKKYHKVVVKKQEEKLKDIQEKERQKVEEDIRKDNIYKESINKILVKKLQEKEFDGIPVTDEFARETFDYLYTKKWKTPNGKLITDFDKEILELDSPDNYERKVKIGLLLNILKKDPELKTLGKRAISKTSNSIFSELAEKKVKKNTVPKQTPSSWFNK